MPNRPVFFPMCRDPIAFFFFLRSQCFCHPVWALPLLEAQQRYFSYRAIAVAIISQNSFVLVFMGYCTIIARYVAKWGIAQMCLCGTKCQGGVSHHFGESANLPEKVSRDMGYRSDSIAVSRDMGPLSFPRQEISWVLFRPTFRVKS